MPFVNQEQFAAHSSRTALLMEVKDKDGNKQVIIYHLTSPVITLEQDYDIGYNIFDASTRILPQSTKVTIEAYLSDPRRYEGNMPDPNQGEVEHTKAITDGTEEEIVYEADEFEDWEA
jgi:hypothetical protein